MELMSVAFGMAVIETCFPWFVVVVLLGMSGYFLIELDFSNLRTLEGERSI